MLTFEEKYKIFSAVINTDETTQKKWICTFSDISELKQIITLYLQDIPDNLNIIGNIFRFSNLLPYKDQILACQYILLTKCRLLSVTSLKNPQPDIEQLRTSISDRCNTLFAELILFTSRSSKQNVSDLVYNYIEFVNSPNMKNFELIRVICVNEEMYEDISVMCSNIAGGFLHRKEFYTGNLNNVDLAVLCYKKAYELSYNLPEDTRQQLLECKKICKHIKNAYHYVIGAGANNFIKNAKLAEKLFPEKNRQYSNKAIIFMIRKLCS